MAKNIGEQIAFAADGRQRLMRSGAAADEAVFDD
jgi:hypothetical protein